MFIIIVTKASQPTANQWMKDNVDQQGGEWTFTRKLYTGVNHTHYVACFNGITDEQLRSMDAHFPYTYDVTDADGFQEVLTQRGLNTGPEDGA